MALSDSWSRLSQREQKMATVAVGVLGLVIILAIPGTLSAMVSSRKADNEAISTALAAVQAGRGEVRLRQSRKDVVAQRYDKKVPPLAGFLEQTARANKLEVSDSVDHPDVPHGKKFTERNTVIHLKKSGMLHIAKFLETLEQSKMPISITRLNIRKRTGEPDSYDVEVGVSAFDRVEAPPAADKDGDKDKGDKK